MLLTVKEHDLRAQGLDPDDDAVREAVAAMLLGRPQTDDDLVVFLGCFCETCDPSD